jgi:hypothetical protein
MLRIIVQAIEFVSSRVNSLSHLTIICATKANSLCAHPILRLVGGKPRHLERLVLDDQCEKKERTDYNGVPVDVLHPLFVSQKIRSSDLFRKYIKVAMRPLQ